MKKKNRKLICPLLIMGIAFIVLNGCKKDNADNPSNTVKDVDGNVYKTITIGTQIWMTENLKVMHFNDGTIPIPVVTDSQDWQARTNAACCMYDNDRANFNIYGILYNWYAASDSKLCPVGWHVATNDEWIIMNTYLNDDATAGNKLKEVGTTHWGSPNTGANNSTGFTALPGGERDNVGTFRNIGYRGYTWSSTRSNVNPETAWSGWLSYDRADVAFSTAPKKYGFSVRCIKGILAQPSAYNTPASFRK